MKLRSVYGKMKAWLNPQEWQLRLLGLKVSDLNPAGNGLVLIQIDGLSFPDLERAMKKGHMPFLRRLMRREQYRLNPMFSGIPSNTPSFQGEFFFGQQLCVPSFQYLNKETGEVFTMFDKNSAAEVEKSLMQKDSGLLAGGSAYGNIFSGGAAEPHICAATADFGAAVKTWNPYSLLVTLLFSPWSVLRGIFLCLAECVLALADFFRSLIAGRDVIEEFRFIIMRVLVSIMMREMITAHARVDVFRGVPVIHVNYFGYDEQAHRRGPSTRFAYWSLSGIDAAIRRIWFSAMRAKRRHYDVWIYSDHGQEKVEAFASRNGKNIQRAANDLYDEINASKPWQGAWGRPRSEGVWGDTILSQRKPGVEAKTEDAPQLTVTTMGPISQIYFPLPQSDAQKRVFAKKLIQKNPSLPLIAVPLADGTVEYAAGNEVYRLPQDGAKMLGADHPYLEGVIGDLDLFFKHESRGDLTVFGWRYGAPAVSFSNENGAHAGLGPRETQAFALLPADAPLQKTQASWMRAADLRGAALNFLGKSKTQTSVRAAQNPPKQKLRVLSYNVHSCVGLDGIVSEDRIARVIAKLKPDVVALQELDAGLKKKGANQAASIAKKLEMDFHFHPVCGAELQCFGNAILSRYPMKLIRAEALPLLRPSRWLEPRGLLWVQVDFHGQPVNILNTHLSLWGPELKLQIKKLLGPDVLGNPGLGESTVLCGDFNLTPESKYYRLITQHFTEPRFDHALASWNTWISQWPIRRLDHILVRGGLEAEIIPLTRTRLETFASDHLPTAADIQFVTAPVKETAGAGQKNAFSFDRGDTSV